MCPAIHLGVYANRTLVDIATRATDVEEGFKCRHLLFELFALDIVALSGGDGGIGRDLRVLGVELSHGVGCNKC